MGNSTYRVYNGQARLAKILIRRQQAMQALLRHSTCIRIRLLHQLGLHLRQ